MIKLFSDRQECLKSYDRAVKKVFFGLFPRHEVEKSYASILRRLGLSGRVEFLEGFIPSFKETFYGFYATHPYSDREKRRLKLSLSSLKFHLTRYRRGLEEEVFHTIESLVGAPWRDWPFSPDPDQMGTLSLYILSDGLEPFRPLWVDRIHEIFSEDYLVKKDELKRISRILPQLELQLLSSPEIAWRYVPLWFSFNVFTYLGRNLESQPLYVRFSFPSTPLENNRIWNSTDRWNFYVTFYNFILYSSILDSKLAKLLTDSLWVFHSPSFPVALHLQVLPHPHGELPDLVRLNYQVPQITLTHYRSEG